MEKISSFCFLRENTDCILKCQCCRKGISFLHCKRVQCAKLVLLNCGHVICNFCALIIGFEQDQDSEYNDSYTLEYCPICCKKHIGFNDTFLSISSI